MKPLWVTVTEVALTPIAIALLAFQEAGLVLKNAAHSITHGAPYLYCQECAKRAEDEQIRKWTRQMQRAARRVVER
jgi:hypothetical protein